MPLKRPTPNDTEDDLLRLQAQFLKKKEGEVKKDVISLDTLPSESLAGPTVPATRKRKKDKGPSDQPKEETEREVFSRIDQHDRDIVSILTNIAELDVSNRSITTPAPSKRGFPCVNDYQVTGPDNKATNQTGKKKSLFARQFDKTHNFVPREREKGREQKPGVADASSFLGNVISRERAAIEEQTNKILGGLTEDQKREEAEKIFKNMDPKLVEFLKKRKKEAQESAASEKAKHLEKSSVDTTQLQQDDEPMETLETTPAHSEDFLNPTMRSMLVEGEELEVPIYVEPGSHPNMGVLEPQKLAWMSDLPKTKPVTEPQSKEDEKKLQVRFDFDGKIVPRGTDIHLDRGLHHHGEEPSEAGYTIDELFILSRSAVLRQREIALETLLHVTQRARHVIYVPFVQQPMLQLLLDSGIVQLYRHALDSPQYELALQGLASLLLSPTEIFIQDELYSDCSIYTLQPATPVTKDMDHDTVLATDVVRLLVDSQLPQRLWYLLTKHEQTVTLTDNILNLVQHLVQHSLHVAQVFLKHRILIDELVKLFLPSTLNHLYSGESGPRPSHVALKILRILSSHSSQICEDLLRRYELDTIIKLYLHLNLRDFDTGTGEELLRCQLEVGRLWEVQLHWGNNSRIFPAIYPLICRCLCGEGQSSVKLTSCLISAVTRGQQSGTLSWEETLSVYTPLLTSLLTWAKAPPSGEELPPRDDVQLMSVVLNFLCSFVKIHHAQHYNIKLVDTVSELVDRIIRPLVTGTLLDNAIKFLVHCKDFLPKKQLKIASLPTLELHQYHVTTPLDLTTLSAAGENLLIFHTCSALVRATTNFLAACFSVHKRLGEGISGFLGKCSKPVLEDLEKLRRYRSGRRESDVPDLVFDSVTMLQFDYLTLLHKAILKGGSAELAGMETLVLDTGIKLVSELRPGFEYQQFTLISGLLFDKKINKSSGSCGHLFLKNFEETVTRAKIMKSQKYWLQTDAPENTYLLGSIASESQINHSWMLLPTQLLAKLPESKIAEYLTFLASLLGTRGTLAGLPACVQLVHIMKIFLLPAQLFLIPTISALLKTFLNHFSSLPRIDFKSSSLSGYASFYDFYNVFCEGYEAEGYCDPTYAGFVLLPTRCDYALTYRRLLWVERHETLRMLKQSDLRVNTTLRAMETDADMMTLYVTALRNGIGGISRLVALHHVVRFFVDEKVRKEDGLLNLMRKFMQQLPEQVKEEALKFERVNDFNEAVYFEKVTIGRPQLMGLAD